MMKIIASCMESGTYIRSYVASIRGFSSESSKTSDCYEDYVAKSSSYVPLTMNSYKSDTITS